MKELEKWFAEQDFDTEQMPSGHRNRFLEKLEAACEEQNTDSKIIADKPEEGKVISMTSLFKWGLVAGLAILVGLGGFNYAQNLKDFDQGLEDVSPEMAQTQDFFTSTITYELEQLNKQQSPETELIIADTKQILKKLEDDYQKIQKDFKANSDNKTVIAAMIANFQSRIDVLQKAQQQIEQLKMLKENRNEEFI
ncbi:hypothetical protein BST97_07890 [Nonlabens spongiae]|uniref:Anti-sigma factor n=1 Tax=Nonlabens spongiae TaxID=331648 RepID=A0A1W6MJZ4_9FLAO|nr:hypothetical protein [Nonlabens spongiae]ARN77925.1 hypothetical protein BST97_07890 [Nonlabens spongiae]